MATSFDDTTSAGMPSIATSHAALDAGAPAQRFRADAGGKVRGIVDEGKAQVTQALDGIADAAREVARQLEANGAAPIARYATQAADAVAGWSSSVEHKSVDDLIDDTRTLVRTRPAVAVGIALAAGFVLSRFLKATSTASGGYR